MAIADVRLAQGRRVVHAVARHRDHVPECWNAETMRSFCFRSRAREHDVAREQRGQFGIAEALELGAGDDAHVVPRTSPRSRAMARPRRG